MTILRVIRLLALVVWVGGVIFFAFGVAPVAFHTLPSTHEAGLVVGASLRVLHRMGLVAGGVFLLASLADRRLVSSLLVGGMLALTAALQWGVMPKMERDRVAAGGAIDQAEVQSAPRMDFDRLHRLSERMEGGVLLLGLAAVVLTGAEAPRHERERGYPFPPAEL